MSDASSSLEVLRPRDILLAGIEVCGRVADTYRGQVDPAYIGFVDNPEMPDPVIRLSVGNTDQYGVVDRVRNGITQVVTGRPGLVGRSMSVITGIPNEMGWSATGSDGVGQSMMVSHRGWLDRRLGADDERYHFYIDSVESGSEGLDHDPTRRSKVIERLGGRVLSLAPENVLLYETDPAALEVCTDDLNGYLQKIKFLTEALMPNPKGGSVSFNLGDNCFADVYFTPTTLMDSRTSQPFASPSVRIRFWQGEMLARGSKYLELWMNEFTHGRYLPKIGTSAGTSTGGIRSLKEPIGTRESVDAILRLAVELIAHRDKGSPNSSYELSQQPVVPVSLTFAGLSQICLSNPASSKR